MSAGWAQIPVREPRPCAFRDRFYLDGLGALYGLPARCLAYDLNGTALALHRGPLDLQVGEVFSSTVSLSARLLRLACRRSSSALRSLEIGDVLKVIARTERRWGRREKVHEPQAPTLLAERPNVSSCRRMRPIDAQ